MQTKKQILSLSLDCILDLNGCPTDSCVSHLSVASGAAINGFSNKKMIRSITIQSDPEADQVRLIANELGREAMAIDRAIDTSTKRHQGAVHSGTEAARPCGRRLWQILPLITGGRRSGHGQVDRVDHAIECLRVHVTVEEETQFDCVLQSRTDGCRRRRRHLDCGRDQRRRPTERLFQTIRRRRFGS